jgi:hypothetical protein
MVESQAFSEKRQKPPLKGYSIYTAFWKRAAPQWSGMKGEGGLTAKQQPGNFSGTELLCGLGVVGTWLQTLAKTP